MRKEEQEQSLIESPRTIFLQKARTDFVKALSYEYKNRHQFALIMESMGYKINITKDGYMEVCREGKTLLQKELKMIEWGE